MKLKRLCQAHFGMNDLDCTQGCGKFCVRAQPTELNAAIIALIEAVDALENELKKRDLTETDRIPWREINRLRKARKAFEES
jgi:hypothetical protein